MSRVMIVILHLFLTLSCIFVADAAETIDRDFDPVIESSVEVKSVGCLRWRDLGVSLEPCLWNTAEALRKYDGDKRTERSHSIYDQVCFDDSLWLVHPSSGCVERGNLCGIIGPSGAGKTTFLHALGGMTPSSSGFSLTGSVWYEQLDFPYANETNKTFIQYSLSQKEGDIAMLSQNDHFFDMLTPRESLELSAYLEFLKQKRKDSTMKDNHKELAQRKLSLLGLLPMADRRIGDSTKIGDGAGVITRRFIWGHKARKRDSKVRTSGMLSGGERRRLSVAHELITEPKIFLADEPTTGLDSAQAEKVMRLISNLAKERSVPSLCTLHQPKTTIWNLLDSFILLAPGGKMCYAGERVAAISYFKNIGYECPRDINPAEYFIDIVTIDTEDEEQASVDKKRIDYLHQRFLESCTHEEQLNINQRPIPKLNSGISSKQSILSFSILQIKIHAVKRVGSRFAALLQRSWRQNSRNLRVNTLRLFSSVIQASLFATIFSSVREGKSLTKSIADRVALLTYGIINMSMMSLMKTLDLFAREKSVVIRERMRNNYSSLEYLLAKVVAEMPLDAIFSLIFATFLKRLTGLRTSLAKLALTYSLVTISSVSLGFAIGSMASNVETAMSAGVPIMVIFMIVGVINPSGVSSEESTNPFMKFLKLLSPIRWAIEAAITAEFRDMSFGKKNREMWHNLIDLPKMGALAMVRDGNEVLANLGLSNVTYFQLMYNLALLSGVYLLLSWFGLSFCGPKFLDAASLKNKRLIFNSTAL